MWKGGEELQREKNKGTADEDGKKEIVMKFNAVGARKVVYERSRDQISENRQRQTKTIRTFSIFAIKKDAK